ncbi:MAG: hypothetical protein F6K22_15825 [Okeania sp. SIO2F4]|uniref:WD40 repeat domain-containing protein n=1 Tax=Okeania sp. SIO2F4 TaxID=2607790 RepID=UPI00142AF56B|nr:hypothetical protein [Okeania sp. SIO2F4]NES04173.1 hypothetical protein [Okeania sp. SIO2F4]
MQTLVGHNSFIYGIEFSKHGKKLYSASGDGTLKIWKTKNGKLLATIKGKLPKSFMSSDGKMKAVVDDNTVKILSDEGKLLLSLEHNARIKDIRFSPDNKSIDLIKE